MAQFADYLRSQMRDKYPQCELAVRDIVNLLNHFKDLKPVADKFMYNDGTSKTLISLTGTIPVSYKNNRYNIPIAMWIQELHPQVSPICFVKPTSTMQVRQGKHVDAGGRIYLPYLNAWKINSHNLIGCVQTMVAIFSQEPPVFSKPSQPPPRPAPYGSAQRPPYPMPGFTPQGPPTTNYQPNFGNRAPYPNHPMPGYPPRPAGNTPYPPGPAPYGMPYPSQPHPPVPSTNTQTTPYPTPPPRPAPISKSESLDEATMLASLRSAVNDKLKRRARAVFSEADHEMSVLKQTELELKSGQTKLDNILTKLGDEVQEVEAATSMLQQKNDEIQNEIEQLNEKQVNIECDDYVQATTPLYKQVVTSFAEEQAIEDEIYHLGQALHKGVLDVDAFLKHVRNLSRQQFVLRATIQKARKVANLSTSY